MRFRRLKEHNQNNGDKKLKLKLLEIEIPIMQNPL